LAKKPGKIGNYVRRKPNPIAGARRDSKKSDLVRRKLGLSNCKREKKREGIWFAFGIEHVARKIERRREI